MAATKGWYWQMQRLRPSTRWLGLLVYSLAILLLLADCSPRPTLLQWAQENVRVGSSREEAARVLGEKAWYHGSCGHSSTERLTDVFLFGSHRFDQFLGIVVYRDRVDGEYQVSGVYGPDDRGFWLIEFKDCLKNADFEQ
jgi:hypothetical protein